MPKQCFLLSCKWSIYDTIASVCDTFDFFPIHDKLSIIVLNKLSAMHSGLESINEDECNRRMAENGFAPPPPREFCRHILSCRELKAESFKRCLHSVLRGVSL